MHVDDFVDDPKKDKYARWFFFTKRLPAHLLLAFEEFIGPIKLFCEYEGQTYRVTGASRLGDVWLTSDMNKSIGYELRVEMDKCSNWRPQL